MCASLAPAVVLYLILTALLIYDFMTGDMTCSAETPTMAHFRLWRIVLKKSALLAV